jgi:hypothetical protein
MYELWKVDFLAKKLSGDFVFFINPNFIFNGERHSVSDEIKKDYDNRSEAIKLGTYNTLYGKEKNTSKAPIKPNESFFELPLPKNNGAIEEEISNPFLDL